MTTDQNTITNDSSEQDLDKELEGLLAETQKLGEEIDASSKEAREDMDAIEAKVNAGIADAEKIFADLDAIKTETSDELDKLMLEQAEDLAKDE